MAIKVGDLVKSVYDHEYYGHVTNTKKMGIRTIIHGENEGPHEGYFSGPSSAFTKIKKPPKAKQNKKG